MCDQRDMQLKMRVAIWFEMCDFRDKRFEKYAIVEMCDQRDMRLEMWLAIWFEMCDLRDKRFERSAIGETIGDLILDVRFERYQIGKICDWRDRYAMRLEKWLEKCAIENMCNVIGKLQSVIGEMIGDFIWDLWFERYPIVEVIGDLIFDVWFDRYVIGEMCNVIGKIIWEKCDWRSDWWFDLTCVIWEISDLRDIQL